MKRPTLWMPTSDATPRRPSRRAWLAALALTLLAGCSQPPAQLDTAAQHGQPRGQPVFSDPVAFDRSPTFGSLARPMPLRTASAADARAEPTDIRPDRGAFPADQGHTPDAALQSDRLGTASLGSAAISAPLASFEGLSNQDNFNLYGGRVNPPDPVGDVGPNHYVEMINLAFAVYDKQGNRLLGPSKLGDLWAGFAVPDCTDNSGDPVVVYDQLADRWILTQFTTRGLNDPSLPFY
uniref:hypothetical protein n=1 Tax=Deinococcus sp. TaxID=47478 RepID=UPI002869E646